LYYLVEENGAKYLKEHSIPVPMYDVGDTISYTETLGGAVVLSTIEGYEICVSSYVGIDGVLNTDHNIVYHLEDGNVMPEEFVDAVG